MTNLLMMPYLCFNETVDKWKNLATYFNALCWKLFSLNFQNHFARRTSSNHSFSSVHIFVIRDGLLSVSHLSSTINANYANDECLSYLHFADVEYARIWSLRHFNVVPSLLSKEPRIFNDVEPISALTIAHFI